MATRFIDHLLTGDHASRPAFGSVPQGTLYACSDHNLIYQSDGTSAWSTWADISGAGGSGSITASGYTQNTARLLGRTTASAGAIEEITVGTGLSLSAGSLTATGGGITFTSLGTTGAGASFATAANVYLKKVTVAVEGVITEIIAQVKGVGGSSAGCYGALYSDAAGVPALVIAVGSAILRSADASINNNLILNTTVRAVSMPLGKKVAAGDYWLAVVLSDTDLSLAYASGTGSDKTQAINIPTDVSVQAKVDTTNDYSIAATLIS